jgi:hypothetical protein
MCGWFAHPARASVALLATRAAWSAARFASFVASSFALLAALSAASAALLAASVRSSAALLAAWFDGWSSEGFIGSPGSWNGCRNHSLVAKHFHLLLRASKRLEHSIERLIVFTVETVFGLLGKQFAGTPVLELAAPTVRWGNRVHVVPAARVGENHYRPAVDNQIHRWIVPMRRWIFQFGSSFAGRHFA